MFLSLQKIIKHNKFTKMKKNYKKLFPALLLIFGLASFSGCGQPPCEDCNTTCDGTMYENHNISACEIYDPLQNIEWLKDYCKNLNEKQTFFKVSISLYKVIGTDESLFRIDETSLRPMSPCYFSTFKNCAGTTIFAVSPESAPGLEEEFMENKEYVAKLFDYSIPICGVCNPLEDIKWLKEYCKSVKENQNIVRVSIDIFTVMPTDEFVFGIRTLTSSGSGYSTVYKNCAGEELNPLPQDLWWHTTIFNYDKQ